MDSAGRRGVGQMNERYEIRFPAVGAAPGRTSCAVLVYKLPPAAGEAWCSDLLPEERLLETSKGCVNRSTTFQRKQIMKQTHLTLTPGPPLLPRPVPPCPAAACSGLKLEVIKCPSPRLHQRGQ
ncbi:hypothetical protein PAMP_008794 [Pampus punctatissimus]